MDNRAERRDPGALWRQIRLEAEAMAEADPLMAQMAGAGVLRHDSLGQAVACRIARKLASADMDEAALCAVAGAAYDDDPSLEAAAWRDLLAVFERDPACHRLIEPLLFLKGFLAIQSHRVAHWLWSAGRRDLAYYFQVRTSETLTVDIHPAARLGPGLMIDHAHGIVIGETAQVGQDVSMLHGITLGGTGKEDGDRHPKIGDGVLIGAGAKILGNISVGSRSRVAAGSVVLDPVPPCVTVAGVPARVVGSAGCDEPAAVMEQRLDTIVPAAG